MTWRIESVDVTRGDAEPVRDLLREGRLAHAGRAREEQDHRALGLLDRAPGPVAAGHALAHRAQQGLGHERAEPVAVHFEGAPAQQLGFELARDLERLVRGDRRGEQRLGEHALREGRAVPGLDHVDGPRQLERQVLEPAVRAELGREQVRQLLAPHQGPASDRVADAIRGAEGVVEAHAAGHQRVDHDPAHERTPAEGVLDLGCRRRSAAPGCLGGHRAKLTDGVRGSEAHRPRAKAVGESQKSLQLAFRPIVFR